LKTVTVKESKERGVTALGARPRMTPGAVGTRVGNARLRDTAAPTKLLP